MKTVTLFGYRPSTFSQSVALILEEKQVPFVWAAPDMDGDDYIKLHPFKKVPVLVHGDIVLCETLAIMCYVDEIFEGPRFQSVSLARYQELKWISFYFGYFVPAILDASVRARFVRPMFGELVNEAEITRSLPLMERCVSVLDEVLGKSGFIVDDHIGIADLLFLPTFLYFRRTPEGEDLISGAPHICNWITRMEQRNSVKKTVLV